MTELKQIHEFAVKWLSKFCNPYVGYIELIEGDLRDDCDALKFEMDCGKAFYEKYGQAVNDYYELVKIIDSIDDIPLLGSAIYSMWRYYDHWTWSSGAEVLEPENRKWFILILNRLAELSADDSCFFLGIPKKMRLVSHNICFGPEPDPDDEVEQHLTINADGASWFSAYDYAHHGNGSHSSRKKFFRIKKKQAEMILFAVSAYFRNECYGELITDVGDWTLELTNTDGTVFKFYGALCNDLILDGTELSEFIRDTVDVEDLFLFDGDRKPPVIKRITLDYHRVINTKPKEIPAHDKWDYSERLTIDRETQTLLFVQNIGTDCKVTHKYEIPGGVESLLDSFSKDDLFRKCAGNPDDVVEMPDETGEYTITVDYKKKPQRVISDTYDKNGLPYDYPDFAAKLFDFIRFYGLGEILDPAIYKKAKRRQSEYIYCSVCFDYGEKSYYYLTDDDSIEIGDFVFVPAGKDNHIAKVEVVNIEYFAEDDVPLPLDRIKPIIRKCEEEDEYDDDENFDED